MNTHAQINDLGAAAPDRRDPGRYQLPRSGRRSQREVHLVGAAMDAPAMSPPAKRRRVHITRGGLGYFVMGLIVLSGAIWSFGALVEIGNVATTTQSLTTLPAPYAGILFAGSVDLFIFYGYLKCYGPAWQIALSVFHILVGLATSLWFQYQHSKGIVDPVAVSVVPALAVAVSLDTWVVSQLVDWFNARAGGIRPEWPLFPPPEPPPAPSNPTPEPERPKTRTNGTSFTADQRQRIADLVGGGMSTKAIQRDLGVSDRAYRDHLLPLVRSLKADLVPSSNGDQP